MMRGGHLDICVLGAMDLAIGAKQGVSKIVERCSYPLTGIGCVKRIYTDQASLECTPARLRLMDAVEGLSLTELERLVGLPIR